MLLKEIAYDILETIRHAHLVDDDDIDKRLIYNWIHNQRALWIKRKLDAGFYKDVNLLQEYVYTLEIVDTSTVYNSYAKIQRTTIDTPAFIELKFGNTLSEVSSPDLMYQPFSVVGFDALRYSGNRDFITNEIFAAERDNKIWIKYGKGHISPFTIKKISVQGILQDPTQLPGFVIATSTYPINRSIIDFMKDAIINSNLRTVLSTQADVVNDGKGQ